MATLGSAGDIEAEVLLPRGVLWEVVGARLPKQEINPFVQERVDDMLRAVLRVRS